jgi:hypothetical protein
MTTQMKESVSAWPKSSHVFGPDTSPDVERKIRSRSSKMTTTTVAVSNEHGAITGSR